MEIAISWIIFSFVAGAVGANRKIGFAATFILSLLLSPLIGLILAFASPIEVKADKTPRAMHKLIHEGDKLAKKDNIDDAIEKYESALAYSDNAPNTKFKLAKLYSLKKESEKSLKYLEMSIQDGFKDFKKLNNDIDLSYLRGTSGFKSFVTNGYKISTAKTETHRPLSRIEELDKLNSLFEKGILNKEEFENEKKRILSTGN